MNIFISGISGTGMGPLALMAKDAGLKVFGTDLHEGAITAELREKKIDFEIGRQDGKYLEKIFKTEGIDWFVYTSALPKDHTELALAKKYGLKISKRDELIAFLVKKLGLKMVAIAGTHGKTTTTSMIVWLCQKLKIPVSYLVGTNLGFTKSGEYEKGAEFFVYEADEYDRNFLHFHPWLSLITVVSYDHGDIYPTKASYQAAFAKFIKQSQKTIVADKKDDRKILLAGKARRADGKMAMRAVRVMNPEIANEKLYDAINKFPGVGRRFEKICDGVYSDYAHHPEEIAATIELAKEEVEITGKKGVVAVYEPHQNIRQHDIFSDYHDAFVGAEKVFWLPTYLVREDPNLAVLRPEDFVESLDNREVAEAANADGELEKTLKKYKKDGFLILLMTAGPADKWFRKLFL